MPNAEGVRLELILSNRGTLRQQQGPFLEPRLAVGKSAARCHANLLCIPKDHEALQLPIPFEKRRKGLQKSVVAFPSPHSPWCTLHHIEPGSHMLPSSSTRSKLPVPLSGCPAWPPAIPSPAPSKRPCRRRSMASPGIGISSSDGVGVRTRSP